MNGVEARRYNPAEYHSHLSGLFQSFSKFSGTVKENVGLGNVDKMKDEKAIKQAITLAEADGVVNDLPFGLKTQLETPGFEMMSINNYSESFQRHGLSGGEVR